MIYKLCKYKFTSYSVSAFALRLATLYYISQLQGSWQFRGFQSSAHHVHLAQKSKNHMLFDFLKLLWLSVRIRLGFQILCAFYHCFFQMKEVIDFGDTLALIDVPSASSMIISLANGVVLRMVTMRWPAMIL